MRMTIERASRRRFLKTVAAGIAVGGCAVSKAAPEASSDFSRRLSDLDDYAAKSMAAWDVPGMAVVVVKDGKVVHSRGYGFRQLGHDERVDEQTIFPISSATKSFTAAAMAKLVDCEKLTWDDAVIRYLPVLGVDPRITIDHIIRHRSGLPLANLLWRSGALSAEEILARLHLLKPVAAPGERFIYNNNMYLVAGTIIEKVSGNTWRDHLRTELFTPLGMHSTYADSSQIASLRNVAAPHATLEGTVQSIERCPVISAPAGGIHSNLTDLAKWLLFHLEPDVQRRVSVLSPARIQEIHTAPADKSENTTPVKPKTPHAPITRYGLGWFFNDHRGHTIVEHSGVQNGFVAWIAMVPSERVGVAILTNRDRVGLNYALRSWLMDACFGFPVSDWSEKVRLDYKNGYQQLLREAEEKFTAAKKQGTTPSNPIAAYAGIYASPLYGSIRITEKKGSLALQLGSRFHGRMAHWSDESFRVTFEEPLHEDWLVTFSSSNGTLTGMSAKEAPWAPDWYEDAEDFGRFERS
jgi:CubicO group peptidase (beta-lactamase class C family)